MTWLILEYADVRPDECIYGWCQSISRVITEGTLTCVVHFRDHPIGEMHYRCYMLFQQQLKTRDAYLLN